MDRQIIFSAPMVRALLAGRKVQTRRMAWHPSVVGKMRAVSHDRGKTWVAATPWQYVKPGDRLWVREGFAPRYFDGGAPGYLADWTDAQGDFVPRPKFKPSIHMPRQASRLTLTVTDVRVQRLQEINCDDAIAEGLAPYLDGYWHVPGMPAGENMATVGRFPQESFAHLWTAIHGPDAWEANPEVVALTFTVERRNIDAFHPAAGVPVWRAGR